MHNANEIGTDIAYLAKTYLSLEKWGFQEHWRLNELSDSKSPSIIYDSQWCRIKISFNEWHPPHQFQEYSIDIYYGRLCAPNDKNIIVWDNEECYCWHGLAKALHFLDGHTSEHTAKNLFSHDLIKEYSKLGSFESLAYKLPEWEFRKHAFIWREYAPRLFELFDMRRPDLWEQYRKFLKEVYDIKGRNPNIKPFLDHVC